MLLSNPDKGAQYGDQRSVHIQTTKNKRRLKRRRKKRKASTKPLEDRVAFVFKHGRINDYTHPKEVDPFWDTLYRQYEYITYIDIVYRQSIKDSAVCMNKHDIKTVLHELSLIQQHKHRLLTYMMNFMNVMYGSVIQSRFYGWKYYIEDFISKFNEVAMISLNKLKFDVDQTRCSVYFYQAFWLSGLSIVNGISADIKNNQSEDAALNRGSLTFSEEADFDTLYDEHGSATIDMLSTLCEKTDAEGEELLRIKQEQDCEEQDDAERYTCSEKDDDDYEMYCTLNKLLHQIGVPMTNVYNLSDKRIKKLGRTLKKKLTSGEVVLQDKDKTLLSTVFSSKILQ